MNWFKNIFRSERNIIKHNIEASKQMGWKPADFGSNDFSEDLVERIKDFQTKHQLTPTGKVDDATFRRKMTDQEARIGRVIDALDKNGVIICNGKQIPIEWDKVKLYNIHPTWEIPETNYRKDENRDVSMFMVHWDVCLSSTSCHKILKKRGISVHFYIDNDGTIIQSMDTAHMAYHSGNPLVNKRSVGVEISNAYYPKYQQDYVRMGHGERPVLEGVKVHGAKLEPFLGFYPVQIDALKALIKALNKGHNIPLQVPTKEDGTLIEAVAPEVKNGTFKGVVCHYHRTRDKIDCAGLPLDRIVEECKDNE